MNLNQVKQHVKDYLAGKLPERDHCNPKLNWIEGLADKRYEKFCDMSYKKDGVDIVFNTRGVEARNWQVPCNAHKKLGCESCCPETLDQALRNYARYEK